MYDELYMKGVFKCAKEDDERRSGSVKSSSLGIPHAPQEIFKETQASKLGDAPTSPSSSTIISSSLSTLYFYHFMCYVLYLERLAFTFQYALISLLLFVVHNKLDPIMPCLGAKHTPLFPRILIVFIPIFVECSKSSLVISIIPSQG